MVRRGPDKREMWEMDERGGQYLLLRRDHGAYERFESAATALGVKDLFEGEGTTHTSRQVLAELDKLLDFLRYRIILQNEYDLDENCSDIGGPKGARAAT